LIDDLPQALSQPDTAETHMPRQTRRVLCVEDDEDTCEMLSSLLGLINCETSSTATAAEALDKIASERFDLYLLDNWLPGGSGVELCRKIRETNTSTPIIFYSGAALESEREEALTAGAQAYLVKPVDVSLLVETVKNLLAD
jgi:DNA-binding response OmpR family regulator